MTIRWFAGFLLLCPGMAMAALFGYLFADDMQFLLDPGRQAVDEQSASRLGRSDFGVNRKGVEALRAAFAGGAA